MNNSSLSLQSERLINIMCPRPKRLRRVSDPPKISGMKPYGFNGEKKGSIFLHYEEYEALRLCDYDNYNHYEASVLMNVSRPTLTRIYAEARKKIATAIVEGKHLIIEGGKIYFDNDWYSCSLCNCFFNNPEKEIKITKCPLCGSIEIAGYSSDPEEDYVTGGDNIKDICVCPRCGYEKTHKRGTPCRDEICPECKSNMMRKTFLKR
ncbi:MAG: DUF134 domain-containing protein [Bacteroidales bacterium]|nr:DUF134 domain-containing protein [Bacteroidales bacterium]